MFAGCLPNIARNCIVNCAELVTYDIIKELILKYDLMTGRHYVWHLYKCRKPEVMISVSHGNICIHHALRLLSIAPSWNSDLAQWQCLWHYLCLEDNLPATSLLGLWLVLLHSGETSMVLSFPLGKIFIIHFILAENNFASRWRNVP